MDELGDEGAVAGDDAAVGAALLMADLEGAIAAAGDEIASLRRVTEAVPRPGLPPGRVEGGAAAESVEAELARTATATAGVAPVLPDEVPAQAVAEPLSRESTGPAASALPERTSSVGSPAEALGRAAPTRPAPTSWPVSGARAGDQSDALTTLTAAPQDTAKLLASAPVARSVDRLPASSGAPSPTALVDGATAVSAAPVSLETYPSVQQERGFEEHAISGQPVSPFDAAPVSQAAPVRLSGASAPNAAVATPSADPAMAGERDGAGTSQDAGRGGPTEGDVYLDGERVGRWMARHLARELGGPQAAGTGFDPRLGPAWPGSMHGN